MPSEYLFDMRPNTASLGIRDDTISPLYPLVCIHVYIVLR